MRIYLCLMGLAIVPSSGFAACAPNLTTLMSCPIGVKTLDVCADNAHVIYRFGKTGQTPDLELIGNAETVDYTPWAGVGSSIFESVTFASGAFNYEVFSSKERSPQAPDMSGGVIVSKGPEPIADLHCDHGQVDADIDALFEIREAMGLCYDHASFSWGACH